MPLIDPVTMSSAVTKTTPKTSGTSTPKELTELQSQSLQPTSILPSSSAQTAKHALPALQLGLFLIRFDSLVADPVSTMWTSLPLVALIQAAYVLTCLPVAGSGRGTRKHRASEKKKEGGSNVYVVCSHEAVIQSVLAGMN